MILARGGVATFKNLPPLRIRNHVDEHREWKKQWLERMHAEIKEAFKAKWLRNAHKCTQRSKTCNMFIRRPRLTAVRTWHQATTAGDHTRHN